LEENAAPERQSKSSPSWAEIQAADDCALMELLVAGSDDALAAIVDRYQDLILRVARRIVNNLAEAEDVVQNIFLEIYQNPGKFDPSRGTLKVWLLQYAYTRSINRRHYLERRQFYSSVEVENIPPVALAVGSTDGRHLAPAETVRLIREVLGMLNKGQEAAIRLVYFEGLTFSEAALKTGETQHIVRHNYYRGLMKLRELIRSKGASDEAMEKGEAHGEHAALEVKNLKPRTI
jgi:RNA polymerase sigma-70 factor, ECF subfamily